MAPSRIRPPWYSLGSSIVWTLSGVVFGVVAGLAEPGSDGTSLIGVGLMTTALGVTSLVGVYWEEFVVECRDLKERVLGQRRTKYEL